MRNRSTPRISTASAMMRESIGSVSLKKAWTALAPSIAAASNGSLGKARRPAIMISTMNGVHCQTSASRMPNMALLDVARIG